MKQYIVLCSIFVGFCGGLLACCAVGCGIDTSKPGYAINGRNNVSTSGGNESSDACTPPISEGGATLESLALNPCDWMADLPTWQKDDPNFCMQVRCTVGSTCSEYNATSDSDIVNRFNQCTGVFSQKACTVIAPPFFQCDYPAEPCGNIGRTITSLSLPKSGTKPNVSSIVGNVVTITGLIGITSAQVGWTITMAGMPAGDNGSWIVLSQSFSTITVTKTTQVLSANVGTWTMTNAALLANLQSTCTSGGGTYQ